ncbi:MAG: YegS/Rv2252/BmrU family lipid kinase [Firmicutes bacterium]|nr:YegS/Rv2252/BmrU family lipid kinase [Bacillota bacterium]
MTTDKIIVIYNPNSGKGRGEKFANRFVSEFKQKGIDLAGVFCSNSLGFIQEFCDANAGNVNSYSLAIIIGGDGTLGPWIDGMVKNNIDIPIFAFGRGTANDFPTYMKTNKSVKRAVKIICNANIRSIDLLKVNNSDYAINVAGGGAFTNGVTKYSKKGKRMFGKLAYKLQGACEACKMKSQQMKFVVDGKEIYESVFFFLVLNTANAGSIKRIAPKALPFDGMLDLFAFRKCGIIGRMFAGISIFLGRAHKSKNLLHIKGKHIEAHVVGDATKNFIKTDVDGNAAGEYPLDVCVAPEKLRVVVNKY